MTTTAKLFLLSLSATLVVMGLISQTRQIKHGDSYSPFLRYQIPTASSNDTRHQRKATIEFKPERNSEPSPCPSLEPVSLEWTRYSSSNQQNNDSKKEAEKRLLIGLMSGRDRYAAMLEITAPINKAYAKEYSHDVLVLQGTSLVVAKDKCNPPGRRATFNKIALLKEALRHRQDYDQLLILDTDAMMYNMDFDVTSLLMDDSTMLVAHRVKKNDEIHTWDINIGVTLWNLHHPHTQSVAEKWEEGSRQALEEDIDTGDQSKLHAVLKTEAKHINALKEEFAYGHGTVVRHYIRRRTNKQWKDPNVLETRLKLLQEAADQVCSEFPYVCKYLERTVYTNF